MTNIRDVALMNEIKPETQMGTHKKDTTFNENGITKTIRNEMNCHLQIGRAAWHTLLTIHRLK